MFFVFVFKENKTLLALNFTKKWTSGLKRNNNISTVFVYTVNINRVQNNIGLH